MLDLTNHEQNKPSTEYTSSPTDGIHQGSTCGGRTVVTFMVVVKQSRISEISSKGTKAGSLQKVRARVSATVDIK